MMSLLVKRTTRRYLGAWKKDEQEGEKKSKEEWKAESKKYRQTKLSKAEKEARVQEKIKALAA